MRRRCGALQFRDLCICPTDITGKIFVNVPLILKQKVRPLLLVHSSDPIARLHLTERLRRSIDFKIAYFVLYR